jgi:DNA-binding transcriptional MocR family regulator
MPNTKHHWLKTLDESRKPAYLAIPDLIADDLASGRLRSGDRLPGMRELADALSLNYTTISRAYAEARKRGLLDTRAGSGTFVKGIARAIVSESAAVEMSMNMPPEPFELAGRLRESASELLREADPYQLLRYQDFGGTAADRAAGRNWLSGMTPGRNEDTVLVCPGIHSALVALVSQLARPGETICLDSLAYPGIKAICSQLGVRLQAIARDDEGPLPHAFEALCKTAAPRAFYCNPTIQNPSTLTLSTYRRQALAEVALRHNVPIIEDDAYGLLPGKAPTSIASLAPELTYYVTGFSKTFGAGLRVAYLSGPTARKTQRMTSALRATSVMASPFTVRLATRWIEDGTAKQMLDAIRTEANARQAIAASELAKFSFMANPDGFHLWLTCPPDTNLSVSELAIMLREKNVAAVAGAAFSTDGDPPDAIRLCLGGPQSREGCREGIRRVAEMIEDPHHLHEPMM